MNKATVVSERYCCRYEETQHSLWLFCTISEFCSWDPKLSEKINFSAVCDERLDYAHYIEKVLQIKTAVFLISRIQDANILLSSESETIII